jgi:hypothetical protein
VLLLNGCGRDVAFVREGFLFGSWASADAARAAVETDARAAPLLVRFLVNVVDDGHVDVIHAAVVEKVVAGPVTAAVALPTVAETVVDAAVEADVRTPVTFIPKVVAVTPSPVTWSPKDTDLGGFNPSAGNPEITAVIAVTPVTRSPDIAFSGDYGLLVDGQLGRSDPYRYDNLSRGGGGCRENREKAC